MAIVNTIGVVLNERDVRETSKVVTFFTRDSGKIKALAKGMRTPEPKGKFGTAFEIYSLNSLVYYETENRDTFTLAQADLIDRYDSIRSDIKKSAYASYFVQLVDKSNELCAKDESIYELLAACLNALREDEEPDTVLILFQLKLLNISGFLPVLEDAKGVSKGCLRTIEHIRKGPMRNSLRLKTVSKVRKELNGLLANIVRMNIAEDLPAFNYLQKMRLA